MLAYRRQEGDDRRLVLVSFVDRPVAGIDLPDGPWTVQVSTDRTAEGDAFSGTLGPDQAVVLR